MRKQINKEPTTFIQPKTLCYFCYIDLILLNFFSLNLFALCTSFISKGLVHSFYLLYKHVNPLPF
jgi:hypothetical protein